MIVIVLPDGHQELYYLKDCTPYKIYECTVNVLSVDRYVFTDDHHDRVGLSGQGDGNDYLIL